MEYKPTTKIVLPRGNGKSMECLKGLCKIFYKKNIMVSKNMNMLKDTFMN